MAKKDVSKMTFDELVVLTDSEKDDLLKANMSEEIKAQFMNANVNLNRDEAKAKVAIKNSLLNINDFDLDSHMRLENSLEKVNKTREFLNKRFDTFFPGEQLTITVKKSAKK